VEVRVDPRYFRPREVETLLGDLPKAKGKLGWTLEIAVQQMCADMVETDLAEARRCALLTKHGYPISLAAE
jgi:GDPmannose 4,6-dehydratase